MADREGFEVPVWLLRTADQNSSRPRSVRDDSRRQTSDSLPRVARFRTYADFWPFYLGEHAKPSTRAVHYVGTIASALALVVAVITQNWWWLIAVPFFGYGPAWFGHFFIEKNKPATFEAPLWSLISDWRMCGLWLTGRLGHELMKYQIRG